MATDYAIKIANAPGESKITSDYIVVDRWCWGAYQPTSGNYSAGGNTGKVSLGTFGFSYRLDKSYPKLHSALTSGGVVGKCTFTASKATGGDAATVFYTVEMDNVNVAKVHIMGEVDQNGQGSTPLVHVELAAGKITQKYTQTDETGKQLGNVQTAYDAATNKTSS